MAADSCEAVLQKFLNRLKIFIPEVIQKGMKNDEANNVYLIEKLTIIISEVFDFRSDFTYALQYMHIYHNYDDDDYKSATFWKDFWPVFRDKKNGVKQIYKQLVDDLWEIEFSEELREEDEALSKHAFM